jgi:riboflavin kinase / FMN adenylyltransferase
MICRGFAIFAWINKAMQVHNLYEDLNLSGTVITVGIFDGVHRGHRALLSLLVQRAKEKQLQSAIVTFSSHPKSILGSASQHILTTPEEKTHLLAGTGVDHLFVTEFTRELSNMRACEFVKNILAGRLSARHLILGYNHHLGKSGEGTFETVRNCMDPHELTSEQADVFQHNGTPVSSSAIRALLSSGDVEYANELLGYEYSLSGRVIEGKRIGRNIGFPTANIEPLSADKLVPGHGVYAVRVETGYGKHAGMLSIGTNPTINPQSSYISIEVHIIGFNSDIYNSRITVSFVKKLRDEIKFSGTADLATQMEADKQETLRILT